MSVFSTIAQALGAPNPDQISADVSIANQQLQTAFSVLIGEGGIIISFLLLISVMLYKERRG